MAIVLHFFMSLVSSKNKIKKLGNKYVYDNTKR